MAWNCVLDIQYISETQIPVVVKNRNWFCLILGSVHSVLKMIIFNLPESSVRINSVLLNARAMNLLFLLGLMKCS